MLPELNGKLNGFAVRAPVPTGSVVDLDVRGRARDARAEEINAAVQGRPPRARWRASSSTPRTRSSRPTSSRDPHSSIFDARLTMVIDGSARQGRRLVRQRVGLLEPPASSSPARSSRRRRAIDGAAASARRASATPSVDGPARPRPRRLQRPARRGRQQVADDTRIRAALPTLELLRDARRALVLASHLGRPKDGGPGALAGAGRRAARRAARRGRDAGARRSSAAEVEALAAGLDPGDVLLLENTRFEPGETKNDPELAERAGRARRRLRQRRLRRRAPRPRLDRRRRAAPAPRVRGPAAASARSTTLGADRRRPDAAAGRRRSAAPRSPTRSG